MESELWKVFSDISPFLAHHLMTTLDGQVLNSAPSLGTQARDCTFVCRKLGECSLAVSWTRCGATLLRLLQSHSYSNVHRVKTGFYKGAYFFVLAFPSLTRPAPGLPVQALTQDHVLKVLFSSCTVLASTWSCAAEVSARTPHSHGGGMEKFVLRADGGWQPNMPPGIQKEIPKVQET